MKVSPWRIVTSLLIVALGALLVSTGRVAATEPPSPDLTGEWLGTFVSATDGSVGEVFLHVDAQQRHRFDGFLGLNLLRFDIRGTVLAQPPDPDTTPPDPDAEPPEPDNVLIGGNTPLEPGTPAVRIGVRGTVNPPDPDRPAAEIVADYRIFFADGSMDVGLLRLVKVGSR